MLKKISLLILLIFIALLVFLYYKYKLGDYISFSSIKNHQSVLRDWYTTYKLQFIIFFICFYTLSCVFVVPLLFLAANIIAGFIFGIYIGIFLTLTINILSTIFIFLASRFLLRKFIESNFKDLIYKINRQLNQNGILYIFFIRAFPIMPLVISTSIIGITRINFLFYLIISQVAIFPEILLTLYIGHKLNDITSFNEVMNTKSYTIMFTSIVTFAIIYWIINKKISNNKKIRQ